MIFCSVVNCSNSFLNNPARVSFHEFPQNNRDVLEYWINFTGRSNFNPTFNSKICSAHFEDDAYFNNSSTLKPEAYPTILGNTSCEAQVELNRNSQNVQSIESSKDSVFCVMNHNTLINKVMIRRSLNESNSSLPVEVSNTNGTSSMVSSHSNFPLDGNSRIVLNYNNSNYPFGGAECYVPLEIKVPVNLLRMEMSNVHTYNQNQLTSLALPSSNSYRQSITYIQHNTSQTGPIKVVDMKKLLQPPQEDATTICTKSANEQDCETVKEVIHGSYEEKNSPEVLISNRHRVQTECTSSRLTNVVTTSSLNISSKVTVSQVLNCLKVILPVKFDLARLVPNDKVAVLVIRYLKLQYDNDTKNTVIMYLRIIVDAAKAKEKHAGVNIMHPYLKINEIALQLALEKVLPLNFAMSDVSNLVLNCLCIVLNQEVYIDGYQILRKLIQNLISDKPHCNKTPNQESDKNKLTVEKRTCDEQPFKKFKSSMIDAYAKRMEKLDSKGRRVHKISLSRSKIFQNINQARSTSKSTNLSFPKKLKNDVAERWKVKSNTLTYKRPINENLSNKSIDKIPFSTSNNEALKSLKRKKFGKVEVKLEDEEWITEKAYLKKGKIPRTKKRELQGPELMEAIESYLEKQQCSAKDVLSSFRNMFYLCRFLCMKSRQSNIQKLNESLSLIAQKNSEAIEDKVSPNERIATQLETLEQTCTKQMINTHGFNNKLRIKPIVVLRDLINYEKEDMLFMKSNKVKGSYYSQQVPDCKERQISSKRYSSDHVQKLTCESYKMFRKIVVNKNGDKVAFCLKYSKLAPGSLVFVKDFRKPFLGWLKGSIIKMVNSLKYIVQLGSGEMWWCAPEQLRPLPQTETQKPNTILSPRSQRVIKPRQLFDL